MAKIDRDEVKRLAKLASIALTDEEIDKLAEDLKSIFKMVEEINAFDTEGVEPTAQITGLKHVTRPDEERSYDVTSKQLLDGAPAQRDDQIEVPSVQ